MASTAPICSAASSCTMPWLDRPAARILPSRLRSVKTCQYSSSGVPSSAGQCIWWVQMAATSASCEDAEGGAQRGDDRSADGDREERPSEAGLEEFVPQPGQGEQLDG